MPQSESEQLAAFLAKTIASQVIGKAASELIANPLLSALNISDSSQQKFQQEVLAQLGSIRDQLKDVQSSLVKINTAVEQLQQSINSYAISAALANYYTIANRINSRYRFFVDGVAALASSTADHGKAAADLWVRLSPPNDQTISDAMDEIHAFVVPNTGVQGLFDIILTGMRDAMSAFAQDGNNYKIEKLGEYSDYWIPSDGGMFSTRRMLTGSYAAARDYLVKLAVPVMKHVLATEIKGLMLLTRAWAGGLHDDRIKDYVDDVLAQADRMKRFFAERAVPAARQLAPSLLKQYGKNLKGDTLKRGTWSQLPLSQTGASRTYERVWGPYMVNDEWVMWEPFIDVSYNVIKGYPIPSREEEWKWGRQMAMVFKPWEGGVRSVHLLDWNNVTRSAYAERINQQWEVNPPVGDYFTVLSPSDFLKRTDAVKYISERIGELGLDFEGQLGVKVDTFSDSAPAALGDLVNTLPTKREQLKP